MNAPSTPAAVFIDFSNASPLATLRTEYEDGSTQQTDVLARVWIEVSGAGSLLGTPPRGQVFEAGVIELLMPKAWAPGKTRREEASFAEVSEVPDDGR